VEEALMARVLALTSRLPYPPREGHQLRSWHILRALAGAHEVTLLSCLRDDDAPQDCAPLREILAALEVFPIRAQQSRASLAQALLLGVLGPRPFVAEKYASATMRARVAELAGACDLVHVDMLPLMPLAQDLDLPLVLNAHNVEHALLRQRAATEPRPERRWFLRGQAAKLEQFERAACRRADRIIACSQDDARELAALAPRTPVAVIPNGVDVERNRPRRQGGAHAPRLVFVGGMGWFPNREGVEWFLDAILPRVRAPRADVEFVLVGKSAGLRVPDSLQANVRLAGFVDDVGAWVDAADICVVPLRSGSGTRLKVLEAMAFAKPIVTTTIGAQGIDLEAGGEALFADSAEAFAAAILHLLAAPQEAARLGAAARAKAQARYDWSAIGRDLLAVYAGLPGDQRAAVAASQR
jgi:glycosyltransferase involved in cell wall biosynthesis